MVAVRRLVKKLESQGIMNFQQLREGQFTDFFSYTSLEITKKSHTKSQNHEENHIQKASKSQITEKLLKNHTKKSLKTTKITNNHREKIM